MRIDEITRPWQKKHRPRYNDTSYYATPQWKSLRTEHRKGFTKMPDGTMLSNMYCVQCYLEYKVKLPGSIADHIIQREEGGKDELSNLQTLCDKHHASKSANEKNAKYKGK